jgi:hypothetical protein
MNKVPSQPTPPPGGTCLKYGRHWLSQVLTSFLIFAVFKKLFEASLNGHEMISKLF